MRYRTLALFVFVVLFAHAQPADSATCSKSISQYGITWFFDGTPTCGQFATGDWWVVGPLTITNITPKDTIADGIAIHGSQINPTPHVDPNAQAPEAFTGFDSRMTSHSGGGIAYNAALNVALSLPLVVPSNSSVLSAESYWPNRPRGRNVHWPWLATIAVLTVLPSAPLDGSFRPPYVGTNKTIPANWNISTIDYAKLNTVAPTSGAPSIATLQSYAVEPQIEIFTSWKGRYAHPANNYLPSAGPTGGSNPNYGQSLSHVYGAMLLGVNMNFTNAQKAPIVYRLIQLGIDIYGAAINMTGIPSHGIIWASGGGHNMGRMMPLAFAGHMLNDADIFEWADFSKHKITQEHDNFFYVTAADIAMTHTVCCRRQIQQYVTADIGKAEWGAQHLENPVLDNALLGASYRGIAGGAALPHALAAHLMGIADAVNLPAMFDYYDDVYVPYLNEHGAAPFGDSNWSDAWQLGFWKKYRYAPPPSGSAVKDSAERRGKP